MLGVGWILWRKTVKKTKIEKEKVASDVMLEREVKRVLLSQGIASLLLVLGIVVFYGFSGQVFIESESPWVAELIARLTASIYGSMLAIAGTILSARSIRSRNAKHRKDASVSASDASILVPIYSGLLNKLVIVGGGIGFGLIVLGLGAIFVVMGYFIVQLAVVAPWVFANDTVE